MIKFSLIYYSWYIPIPFLFPPSQMICNIDYIWKIPLPSNHGGDSIRKGSLYIQEWTYKKVNAIGDNLNSLPTKLFFYCISNHILLW